MISYVVRRVLATIPVMLLVALIVFSLLYAAPGDPASIIAGEQASPEEIVLMREALGLNQPFVLRFVQWLGNVVTGDLGNSMFFNVPVLQLVLQRVEPTLLLMSMAMALSLCVAVPLGVLAASQQGRAADRAVMLLAVLGFSVPIFIVGYILAWFFALKLGWFPVQGYTPLSQGVAKSVTSLVLPAVALGTAYVALIARITRATMLEVLSQDYVRTARAKGLTERVILFSHALKNAAVPIATVAGLGVAILIGGSVAVETVFAVPGLGRLIVDAILRRDYPVIQGMLLLFSASYVLVNLLVDLSYTLFDPRIRYS